ncbi:hypothetical protein BCF44_105204 [Kutzneria buriramensis]|uniref:Abortive infection protein n=2 Tax=Kutzneria buriramensis TaxID=1045776 RepID=A0A3E0HQ37_9PSEU|nr:hypothetical protein BCF44_105204 [Kutzneria buriramensis]
MVRRMRANGISYDTGFLAGGTSTHEPFDPDVVRREMRIIRDDLHCTAVRVTGGDPERLDIAATTAAELGLEVWFSPFTCDLTQDELLAVLADCADRAERLRRGGAKVVLLTGAELSMFTVGFLPGDTIEERMAVLADLAQLREAMAGVPALLNEFLGRAVKVVRDRFGGPVSYAAIPSFEGVDWTPFDFVGVDLYRSAEVAGIYVDAIRSLVAQGKPVAITEFGAATFRGAADKGAHAGGIVVRDGVIAVGLDGDYERDEDGQAAHLMEMLDIFEEAGVDTAFAYTFANYHLPHRPGPRKDLDLASYGVVTAFEDRFGETYPDMRWEPKAAFAALARKYL